MVAKYSEETYREVAEISDVDEAIRNPARKALKDDIATVYQIAKTMRWESNMINDPDKKLYPEFWSVFDRLEKLHCAVGILNRVTGIRRDLKMSDR